ncbi:M15 family metallopeptidase [Flavobacterium sp. FPG59]|uniref:M15 family metallopeptidase n=1 Tax=Flavobacterium sp. FPG59 TaxID=1929267 RepID=UPI000A3CAE63|nr:M15 family metallopeptidase [Flavobacterium sp. FPG59]OUD36615.1 peptidase M15 [Flavobacterium sp. FPG59]
MKLFFLSAMFLFLNSALAQSSLPNSLIEKNDKVNDTTFVNLKTYSDAFVYDMKYATDDNFLKAKVYDCSECFLRLKTVKALVKANNKLAQKGYKIKIYDCYRPLDIQKKMWEIVPNPKYVANPKTGSIHNRGGAVDISLVTLQGEAVDMGTDFDFFGEKASHLYQDLPKNVLQNRKLLKSVMISAGFNSFDSEWWHYNLKAGLKNPVSNTKWECE